MAVCTAAQVKWAVKTLIKFLCTKHTPTVQYVISRITVGKQEKTAAKV